MIELKIHKVAHLQSEITRLERLSGIDVRAYLVFGSTNKSVFYLKGQDEIFREFFFGKLDLERKMLVKGIKID